MTRQMTAFDSLELNEYAAKYTAVSELWGMSSPPLREKIAEVAADFSQYDDKNEIIIANFVMPAIECLRKGYTEEFVREAPGWKLRYAAEFTGEPEEFEQVLQKYGITEDTPSMDAIGMLKARLPWEQYVLNKYTDAELIVKYLPDWAKSRKDILDFARVFYRKDALLWYLAAVKRANFEDTMECSKWQGDKLVALCLRKLRTPDRLDSKYFGYCRWVCIATGKEKIVLPVYRWEDVSELLDIEARVIVQQDGDTLFVYTLDNSIPLLPVNQELPDVEDPVVEINKSLGKKFGVVCERLDPYREVYQIWLAICRGSKEWLLYLKYNDYFSGVHYRDGKSFVGAILESIRSYPAFDLSFGTIKIGTKQESVILAEANGDLKSAMENGERIYAGANKENVVTFNSHLTALVEWLQGNSK